MSQVEQLKIFLASPGDVATERRHVMKVVEELNRTVAADKGIVLVVVSSENAFPGYGKDGQAILNEQIGKMQEYSLFVGVMWHRIGTPTPRAKSGTAEEFGRAVGALRRNGKPQIWFYFRESPAHLTTKEELEQRAEVIKFKKDKFRGKGYFKDYKTPAAFRDQFREQLTLWLNQYKGEASQSRTTAKKQSGKTPRIKTKSESSTVASDRRKTTSEATEKKALVTPQKIPVSKSSKSRSVGTVKTPGAWVMLNEKFFRTESIAAQPDRSIVLQLSPTDTEQVAELRSLQPGEFHNRKQVAYADQHEATITQVLSVLSKSVSGRTRFNVTLVPIPRSPSSSFALEMNYNNYSADKIAEFRTRLILLGQPLPKDLRYFFPATQITDSYNSTAIIEKGLFPELWTKLKIQPRLFLPKAWLAAVYHLKMSQLIEDVLELELGPVKNKIMPVRFQGRRRRFYTNQEPSIIKVTGNCTLAP